jgi:hypothetical protein
MDSLLMLVDTAPPLGVFLGQFLDRDLRDVLLPTTNFTLS